MTHRLELHFPGLKYRQQSRHKHLTQTPLLSRKERTNFLLLWHFKAVSVQCAARLPPLVFLYFSVFLWLIFPDQVVTTPESITAPSSVNSCFTTAFHPLIKATSRWADSAHAKISQPPRRPLMAAAPVGRTTLNLFFFFFLTTFQSSFRATVLPLGLDLWGRDQYVEKCLAAHSNNY